MADYTITLEEQPSAEDARAVVTGLVAYNDSQAEPEGAARLVLLVRDGDGTIRGGLLGYTHWNWLFVSHLWVHDSLRGRGLGRELLGRAEAEGIARGCRNAHLDTFSFQARGFYESLGYEVFGTLDDYPPGHSRYFLRKRGLRPTAPG
jgi:ribosomal protein S18 acetylase RimI-like enzyme